MKQDLQQRLDHLLQSIKLDQAALHAGNVRYPDGEALFDQLFDAAQSTLQNAVDSSADEPQ